MSFDAEKVTMSVLEEEILHPSCGCTYEVTGNTDVVVVDH